MYVISGSNRRCSGKESACQCRRLKICGFKPWVGKIPWKRKWQPTPVCLPGKSHGQGSLEVYSPGGHKESDMWTEPQYLHFIVTVTLHLVPKMNGGWQSDEGCGDSSICNRGGTETEETLRCLQNEGGKVKPYSNVDWVLWAVRKMWGSEKKECDMT